MNTRCENMKIQVKVKSNYGTARVYPVDEPAKIALELIGSNGAPKSFPMNKIEMFTKLGIKFVVTECDESVDARYAASQIDSLNKK